MSDSGKPSHSPSISERITEAIIRRIEGVKDLKKRLDYLMNPETLSSSARLTDSQVEAVAECAWLAKTFPSLQGLADFTKGYAAWSISKDGKGREEVVSVMISESREIYQTLGITPFQAIQDKSRGKEEKKGKE
jgi:hypothetical protein